MCAVTRRRRPRQGGRHGRGTYHGLFDVDLVGLGVLVGDGIARRLVADQGALSEEARQRSRAKEAEETGREWIPRGRACSPWRPLAGPPCRAMLGRPWRRGRRGAGGGVAGGGRGGNGDEAAGNGYGRRGAAPSKRWSWCCWRWRCGRRSWSRCRCRCRCRIGSAARWREQPPGVARGPSAAAGCQSLARDQCHLGADRGQSTTKTAAWAGDGT